MALNTDEQAMRSALHELAQAQPDAPVDRLAGVRRRHQRRRAGQSLAAGLAATAVVAGGLSLATSLRAAHEKPKPASPPPQAWQLAWPERGDGTVDKQRVLFWAGQQGFTDLRHVRWLYDATAPDGISKWAVFEADFPSDPAPTRVNALFTAASTTGSDQWTVQHHGAPAPSEQVIGVAERTGSAVLALAAPGVESVELVDVREGGVDLTSFPSPVDGASVITSGTGWKPGSTLIRVTTAPSTSPVLFDEDAQSSGRAAWLSSHAVLPAGAHRMGTMSGGAGGGVTFTADYTGALLVEVRCAGPVPLGLSFATDGTTSAAQVDRCDGLFHPYSGPRVVRGHKVHIDVSGDQGASLAVIDYAISP